MTQYSMSTDGRTTWINGMYNCLGRYGPLGWEVFDAYNPDKDVNPTYKTFIGPATFESWMAFSDAMKEKHSIELVRRSTAR